MRDEEPARVLWQSSRRQRESAIDQIAGIKPQMNTDERRTAVLDGAGSQHSCQLELL